MILLFLGLILLVVAAIRVTLADYGLFLRGDPCTAVKHMIMWLESFNYFYVLV